MPKKIQPRVMIASPTPGFVKTDFMKVIINSMMDLAKRDVICTFDTNEGGDPVYQRNVLATRFFNNKDFTHLVFADSDMVFPRDMLATMIIHDKPVIGAIYSRKVMDYEQVRQALARGLSFDEAMLFASDWLAFLPSQEIDVQRGIMRVSRLGFGIVMIRRDVLETMVALGVAKPATNMRPEAEPTINFFSMRPEVALDGQHVAEDLSFCDRWRKDCNGELWAIVDAKVFHIGDIGFGGSYFDFLKAVKKLQERHAMISETF